MPAEDHLTDAAPTPVRRSRRRRGALLALSTLGATGALALAAPAAWAIGPEAPHSPNASDLAIAWWVMLVVIVLLVVAINAALIGAVVRFRGVRGRTPQRLEARRGLVGRAGSALGLVAAAILVFGLVITFSARSIEPSGPDGLQASASRTAQVGISGGPSEQDVVDATGEIAEPAGEPADVPEGGDPLEIDVVGQQWMWRFEYPELPSGDSEDEPVPTSSDSFSQLFSYAELTVPVDTAVVLNLTSTDVLHSFWVPALGGQVQAVPGKVSQTWFKADEEGLYEGRSTTFSGSAYPSMRIFVNVVSAQEYETYIEDLGAEIEAAQAEIQNEQTSEGDTPEAEAQP